MINKSPVLFLSISGHVCRLQKGVLYILWLQIAHGPDSLRDRKIARSEMEGLVDLGVRFRGNHNEAVMMSVSAAGTECKHYSSMEHLCVFMTHIQSEENVHLTKSYTYENWSLVR